MIYSLYLIIISCSPKQGGGREKEEEQAAASHASRTQRESRSIKGKSSNSITWFSLPFYVI